MAEHGSDYHHGEMDISHQAATFQLFNGMTKWGSLGLVVLLALLVPWFCTKAGFLPGFLAAIVLTVVGIVFLREKPAAAH